MKTSQSDKKLNLLVAYPYLTDANIELLSKWDRNKYRLIIDSGAFSAFNSGAEIRFEDYCAFLDRIKFLNWDAAVQLDVVFNPKETQINYQRHLDRGDRVCPVFTRGDKWDYMQSLIDNDKYVFVGGVQGGSGAKEFAKYCLERTKGKMIHFLAFVRPDWLIHYRPFSVDSSSWSSSCRFGSLHLYVGDGRIKALERKDFIKRPSNAILNRFAQIGFDYGMVQKLGFSEAWSSRRVGEGNKFETHIFASICSYIKFSVEAQNKIGTRIYLAMNYDHYTKKLMAAYDMLLEKGLI